MRAIILTILLLALPLPSWAQAAKADQLRQALPNLEGQARVDCLNELGREFTFNLVHSDSALRYARLAHQQALSIGYLRGQAISLIVQGDVEGRLLGDFRLMAQRSEQAIALVADHDDPATLSKAYYLLSLAHGNQGLHEQGLAAAAHARQAALAARDTLALGWAIQVTGHQYTKRGEYWKAFENLIQAQKIGKEQKDSAMAAVSLAFIARSFNRVGDPQKALDYYYQCLPYLKRPLLRLFPHVEDMAYAHLQLRQYDSVLYYQEKHRYDVATLTTDEAVLKRFKPYRWGYSTDVQLARRQYDQVLADILPFMDELRRQRDVSTLMQSLLILARVYEGKREYPAAVRHARELLQTAQQTLNQQFAKDGHELMSRLFEQAGQPDSAYLYFKRFITMRDSMDAIKFAQRTALYEAAAQAETRIRGLKQDKALQEQQLMAKQQELQRQSQIKQLLALGLAGLVVCAALVIYTMSLKRKNEALHHQQAQSALQQKAQELEMQALRAQMNPHFIFNCLSAIDNLIQIGDPDKATTYLARFAKLIRLVLDSSKNNLVLFQRDFDTLRLYLEMEQFRCNHKFSYSLTADPELLGGDYRVPPLIIQPFIENAIHHGLLNKPDKCRQLDVSARLQGSHIAYSVRDNGVGRKQAAWLRELNRPGHLSYGIQITRERVRLHNRPANVADVQIVDLEEAGLPTGTEAIVLIYADET